MVTLNGKCNTLFCVALFCFPFFLKSMKKGGETMPKKEQHKVVTHGSVDVSKLNEQQQKTFYISLLTRILTLVKEQKEKEEV